MPRTGDNDLIRSLNYKIILDTIRNAGSISRIEISRKTGLSRSTCSGICERMLRQGLIIETGKSDSSGGRRPTLLEIDTGAGVVIGLKLMDGTIDGAVVDLGGSILHHKVLQIPWHLAPDSYISYLETFVRDLQHEYKQISGGVPLLGLGVGMSGRIDAERGILLESSVLEWKKIPLKSMLEEKFSLPVFLENDVNSFAFGERYFGNGRNYRDFLCLTVGEGIGLGIIQNGDLLPGSHNSAGEIGHMKLSLQDDAPVCACGRRGCLEAYAADRAITAWYTLQTGDKVDIDSLVAKAQVGDPHARAAFARAGAYLGLAISTVVNLFDPEAVIIAGERADAADYFLPEMKKVFVENAVYDLAEETNIIVIKPDNDLWLKGVAALAIREFFSRSESWGVN